MINSGIILCYLFFYSLTICSFLKAVAAQSGLVKSLTSVGDTKALCFIDHVIFRVNHPKQIHVITSDHN